MGKRLVVCMDGTGNATELRTGRNPSNVLHIARAVRTKADDDVIQVTEYIPGVGTLPFVGKRWHQFTGRGLSQDVQHAYEFLAHNYDDSAGDKIYIFGFSRGATAARSLSGFTELFRIIQKADMHLFEHAWAFYQDQTEKGLKRLRGRSDDLADLACQGQTLKDRHQAEMADSDGASAHPNEELDPSQGGTQYRRLPLHFLGVFDTVAALSGEGFHERHLAWNVDFAYHALAVHELRKLFRPELWKEACAHQVVTQVWFPGTHSDVGGGNGNLGLSSIALRWMVEKAKQRGITFDAGYLADVCDADTSAGLKIGRVPYGPGLIAVREIGSARCEFRHLTLDDWRARHPKNGSFWLDRHLFRRTGDDAAALDLEPKPAKDGGPTESMSLVDIIKLTKEADEGGDSSP